MLTSQLEIIEQAQRYLNTVSEEEYTVIISPNFISSAGTHIRHVIDHYLAIMSGIESKLIDYDIRLRGSQLESSPALAKEKLFEIAEWLQNLSDDDLTKKVTLSTEVSITNKSIKKVQSSIARELIFASSHAVHHYAMIAQISFAQETLSTKDSTSHLFGLAPATATFMRPKSKNKTETKPSSIKG